MKPLTRRLDFTPWAVLGDTGHVLSVWPDRTAAEAVADGRPVAPWHTDTAGEPLTDTAPDQQTGAAA